MNNADFELLDLVKATTNAHMASFKSGFDEGFRKGFMDGYKAATQKAIAILEKKEQQQS